MINQLSSSTKNPSYLFEKFNIFLISEFQDELYFFLNSSLIENIYSMRYAIVYVSTVSNELEKEEIEGILNNSKDWNNENGITGLLLFSGGNFFQIIEGEKNKICDLFEDIKLDKRHHNVTQFYGKVIYKEAYDGYDSDFVSEESNYDPRKFQHYLNQTKVLEKSAQIAVENILKAFLPI